MTMIFCDGCDTYTSAAQMANKWTVASTTAISTTGGRYGGGAVRPSFGTLSKTFAGGYSVALGARIRGGFWYQETSGVANATTLLSMNSASLSGALILMSSSGQPQICRLGSSVTVLITASAVNLRDGQWHWIEFDVLLATGATGAAQLWVDGVSAGSVSSTITVNAAGNAPIIAAAPLSGSSTCLYDDIIIWDDQGSDFNTSNIGPQKITTLLPSGDGATLQFTPSTGSTHFNLVNTGWGNTTTWNSDATGGQTDLYSYPALGYSPSTIRAVVANLWGNNPGTATSLMKARMRTGGTTADGSNSITLGSGGVNAFLQTPFYKDNAAAAWTPANVNAMQMGVGD